MWEFTSSKPVINRVIRLWTESIICMLYTTGRCKKANNNTSCLADLSTLFWDLVWREKIYLKFILNLHRWLFFYSISEMDSNSYLPTLSSSSIRIFKIFSSTPNEIFSMMYRGRLLSLSSKHKYFFSNSS